MLGTHSRGLAHSQTIGNIAQKGKRRGRSTRMLTGVEEIDRMLKQLPMEVGNKVAASALGGAQNRYVYYIRRAIEPARSKGKDSASTKAAIGSVAPRYIRQGGGVLGKVGVNVGKRNPEASGWAHLRAMGTDHRYTSVKFRYGGTRRSGTKKVTPTETGNPLQYRGFQMAERFVQRGVAAGHPRARARMLKLAKKAWRKYIGKSVVKYGTLAGKKALAGIGDIL